MEKKTLLHVLINATDSSSRYVAILGVDNDLMNNIKSALKMLNNDTGFKGVRSISLNDMFYVALLKTEILESLGDSFANHDSNFGIYCINEKTDEEIASLVKKYRVNGEMQTCDLTIDTNNKFRFFSDFVDIENSMILKYETQPVDILHIIEVWGNETKKNLELSCSS